MSVLFATSFNEEMYEVSGKRLVKSFVRVGQSGHLFMAYEGAKPAIEDPRYEFFPLHTDWFLRTWLESNKDIIPVALGGLYPPCTCPGKDDPREKHHRKCRNDWMNRNASRFFRKIATLRLAEERARLGGFSTLLWLDSDCTFEAQVPERYLAGLLGRDGGCFYFRGPHRTSVETGIMGFDLRHGGSKLIAAICRVYATGAFREFKRWDDSYMWAKVLEANADIRTRDLGYTDIQGERPKLIESTSLAQYLVHHKGINRRRGIMR